MSLRPFTSLALVATLALAGCGVPAAPAPQATLATLPATASAPAAAAIALSDLPGVAVRETVESTPVVEQQTVIRIVGEEAITDEEMALDADEAGYALQSSITLPGTTGTIRRAEHNTFLLEAGRDHTGVRRDVVYTLKASNLELYKWFGDNVDKRALVRGFFGANNTVNVSYAKQLTSFSFLTNWFTKGKVRGAVNDYAGMPVRGVEVKVRDSRGFVFFNHSSDTGAFAIKNLPPGAYTLSVAKYGYKSNAMSITVKQRVALTLDLKIARSTN